MDHASSTTKRTRDQGSILPLVLVLCVVMAVVVIALAEYATSTLRYGQVVEASTDRLAAADAAMDNALEDFDRGTSPCVLTDLATGSGLTYSLQDTINRIHPSITCKLTGGQVNVVDAFAVVLTGANGQTGSLLTITNGGGSNNANKVFEGPVYMAKTPRTGAPNQTIDLSATLDISQGDLWYTNSTCPANNVQLTGSGPKEVTISPAGYTTKCRPENWQTLFLNRKPPEPTDFSNTAFPSRVSTPPTPDSLGCYVWSPGHYANVPPQLTNSPGQGGNSYNYFPSGDYYFDNIGTWTIDHAFVLGGWPGGTGPSIEDNKPNDPNGTAANNPCRTAWSTDTQMGATFYMGGNSAIALGSNASLEVSGSVHNGFNVAMQALEAAGVKSTLTGDGRIVSASSGNGKQLSLEGLVWAPNTGLEFDLIANKTRAALTGGAVLAELSAGASANTDNFVISVETQPTTSQFEITTEATNSGTTQIKASIDYRTDKVYAIKSRRVLELTPES